MRSAALSLRRRLLPAPFPSEGRGRFLPEGGRKEGSEARREASPPYEAGAAKQPRLRGRRRFCYAPLPSGRLTSLLASRPPLLESGREQEEA
jgi:hypothetical protein